MTMSHHPRSVRILAFRTTGRRASRDLSPVVGLIAADPLMHSLAHSILGRLKPAGLRRFRLACGPPSVIGYPMNSSAMLSRLQRTTPHFSRSPSNSTLTRRPGMKMLSYRKLFSCGERPIVSDASLS